MTAPEIHVVYVAEGSVRWGTRQWMDQVLSAQEKFRDSEGQMPWHPPGTVVTTVRVNPSGTFSIAPLGTALGGAFTTGTTSFSFEWKAMP